MTTDHHPIRNQVIATVLGGLILTGLLWALGYLRRVVTWIVDLGQTLWDTSLSAVPVPFWLFTALLVVCGLLLAAFLRAQSRNAALTASPTQLDTKPKWYTRPDDPVGQIADALLLTLFQKDGGMIEPFEFVSEGRVTMLQLEEAVARLVHNDMIERFGGYGTPAAISLTGHGRSVLLAQPGSSRLTGA